jgi:hypothetical protein
MMKRIITRAMAHRSPEGAGAIDKLKESQGIHNQVGGFVAKLLAWWSVAELAWKVGIKISEYINKNNEPSTVSFCVDDGTEEHSALMAMAAVYLDDTQKTSSLFKLEKSGDSKNTFKPAGTCTINFRGHYITVEKNNPESGQYSRAFWVTQVPVEVLDTFLDEFDKYLELSGNSSDGIYRWSGWCWRRVAYMPEKRVTILPEGQMESILLDAKRFLDAKDWYFEKGIPWRKGYLFYGLPGAGKTSMAICMAISLKRSLYCVSSKECSSSTFEDALRALPRGAVVLVEDIDCIFDSSFVKRAGGNAISGSDPSTPEDEESMTLSDFLNAVDGVTSHKDGRILILTTNHVERLDQAIIRPGRIDKKIEFTHANDYQLELLSKRMLGEEEGVKFFKKSLKSRKQPITMAEAENILLPIALSQIE